MTKRQKWAIIILAIALVTLAILLWGHFFGRTLGALSTVIIWGVLYAIGWKWAGDPKCKSEEEQQIDKSDSDKSDLE